MNGLAAHGSRLLDGPADTARFAAQLAGELRPGDVVLLVGDLGAGKTTLVQGLARALGSDDEVVSPTFTIMRHLGVRWASGVPGTLLHLDAYRLGGPGDLDELGLFELLDDGAAAVIEWGDVVEAAVIGLPRVLRVELTAPAGGGDTREVRWAWR
jgi:tRNA threonylcarbamoyladenosine biosynthesis protein TsaE